MAKQSPPKIIYVDRDCCSSGLKSKFQLWSDMVVQLDVWHFMRQFPAGYSSESHAMYPTFKSHLSGSYLSVGCRRPSAELHAKGNWSVRKKDVLLHTTRKELALHCRCQTHATAETARLIKELIDVFSSDKGKDAMLILC